MFKILFIFYPLVYKWGQQWCEGVCNKVWKVKRQQWILRTVCPFLRIMPRSWTLGEMNWIDDCRYIIQGIPASYAPGLFGKWRVHTYMNAPYLSSKSRVFVGWSLFALYYYHYHDIIFINWIDVLHLSLVWTSSTFHNELPIGTFFVIIRIVWPGNISI